MSKRTKSGMGGDIDPIRMSLMIGAFAGPLYAFSLVTMPVLAMVLLGVGILCSIGLGWWVTRCWYLDVIEGLKNNSPASAPDSNIS